MAKPNKAYKTIEKIPTIVEPEVEANVPPTDKHQWGDVVPLEYFAVRSGPNSTAQVLMYLTINKTVTVELSGKPWLKIRHHKLAGQTGYVSATILGKNHG